MSCFVLNDKALAALARGMETALNGGYNLLGFDAPAALGEALADCVDTWGFFQEKKIFQALHALNMAAYCGRYKDEQPTPPPAWPELEEVPRLLQRPEYCGHWVPGPGFWQYLKLLDCLVYQVSEDATYNAPLRLALVEFSRALAGYLARNNAVYHAAPWGAL